VAVAVLAIASTIALGASGGAGHRAPTSAGGQASGDVRRGDAAGRHTAEVGHVRALAGSDRGASVKQMRATAARSLGELILARYLGRRPSPTLLRRTRDGEVGGVILFEENTAGGVAATARAIASLQTAARAGGTFPLLVMTDQEGGLVKRFPSFPPTHAPQSMRSASEAGREGLMTGLALRKAGLNVDLAPVADVEQVAGSFLGSRSFSSDARLVAERSCAFARGLEHAGVVYTLKHFPGLGTALASTDDGPVAVDTSAGRLHANLAAYRACGHGPLGLVMISSASYPALRGLNVPAVLAPRTYKRELQAAHITLPAVSDDLDAPAIASLKAPARRALNAGLDLLLYAKDEQSSLVAYRRLEQDLRAGSLSSARVLDAAAAVSRLKALIRTE
jgi:beta-N-acetylhexosaminidase